MAYCARQGDTCVKWVLLRHGTMWFEAAGAHEVRLDDESQTAAHDTVAVLPADKRVNVSTRAQCTYRCMQLSAMYIPAQRSLHAAHAFVRNPLHKPNVEANLVL